MNALGYEDDGNKTHERVSCTLEQYRSALEQAGGTKALMVGSTYTDENRADTTWCTRDGAPVAESQQVRMRESEKGERAAWVGRYWVYTPVADDACPCCGELPL